MTPEEYWQQVDVFVNRALEAPSNERDRILAEIQDSQLRQEVASLLNAEDPADDHGLSAIVGSTARDLLERAEPLRAGSKAGRFEIVDMLGRGGMGEVYRARDPLLDRIVALKFLTAGMTSDPDHRRRFEREAKAVSALNHPNIITVYEIGDSEHGLFIATEFIDGMSLRERLDEGPIAPAKAYRIAAQIASALFAAHQAGIVHRDIKPENVILRRDGLVKVLDFGLARTLPDAQAPGKSVFTKPGWLAGTPAYMSPEQIRARPAGAESDCWSLGVLLYEMLTGHHPFLGETPSDTMAAILDQRPEPISDPAWSLVSALLEKDTARRMSDAQTVLGELERLERRRGLSRRIVAIFAAAAATLPILAWGVSRYQQAAPEPTLTYSLLVQRMKDGRPDGAPFRSTGGDVFRSGWKFCVEASSKAPGYLYLLSDSRLVFPLTRQDRSQRWRTGWLVFDETPGTELLWVAWSSGPVEQFEQASGTRDTMPGVHELLSGVRASKAVIEPTQNTWNISGAGNLIAQPISLEHR